MAQAPTWQDLEWLRAQTRLPLLVKGVLHPDDASRTIGLGMDGAIVSNHGGRALDDASDAHSAAIRPRRGGSSIPVARRRRDSLGGDTFKALALGANAVLIGGRTGTRSPSPSRRCRAPASRSSR